MHNEENLTNELLRVLTDEEVKQTKYKERLSDERQREVNRWNIKRSQHMKHKEKLTYAT